MEPGIFFFPTLLLMHASSTYHHNMTVVIMTPTDPKIRPKLIRKHLLRLHAFKGEKVKN